LEFLSLSNSTTSSSSYSSSSSLNTRFLPSFFYLFIFLFHFLLWLFSFFCTRKTWIFFIFFLAFFIYAFGFYGKSILLTTSGCCCCFGLVFIFILVDCCLFGEIWYLNFNRDRNTLCNFEAKNTQLFTVYVLCKLWSRLFLFIFWSYKN
jgi:hypothetical protein